MNELQDNIMDINETLNTNVIEFSALLLPFQHLPYLCSTSYSNFIH